MFYQPYTLEEALGLKRDAGSDAAFLAGGTDLIVQMNHGRRPAGAFVDLTHVADFNQVRPVAEDVTSISIDGGTTYASIAKVQIQCLAQAALSIGGPQIRNRATVAGNLASASPAGDGSVALLALDARLELRNAQSGREVSLCDFFLDYRKTALAPDEVIRSIKIPATWRTGWHKLGKRGAMNISVVCCAVGVSPAGKFHVSFGSVGPFPLLAPETAAFLTAAAGSDVAGTAASEPLQLKDAVIDEAEKLASQEVRPIDDFRASASYRRAMAGALLKKVLRGM